MNNFQKRIADLDIEKLIELEDEVMECDRCYCREYCETLQDDEGIRCEDVRGWLKLCLVND